jgi:hypothetical protein
VAGDQPIFPAQQSSRYLALRLCAGLMDPPVVLGRKFGGGDMRNLGFHAGVGYGISVGHSVCRNRFWPPLNGLQPEVLCPFERSAREALRTSAHHLSTEGEGVTVLCDQWGGVDNGPAEFACPP